jgi:hypothetical protein
MVLNGTGPTEGGAMEEAAFGFLRSARRGDTAWADLDAALMGRAVWEEQSRLTINNKLNLSGAINAAGIFWDLANGDAAGAFSRLPDYQALNAWDMATSMEDFLEGM